MSNRSQDTQNLKASVAENLTKVMDVACAGRRSFAELVGAMDAKKPVHVPVKSVKGVSKQTPGLSPVRQANTAEEMTVLLTPLISERFALSNSVTKKLRI